MATSPTPSLGTTLGNSITATGNSLSNLAKNDVFGTFNNMDAAATNFVNTAKSLVQDFIPVEGAPPEWPATFGGTFAIKGNQSTPGLARGALTNTGVLYSNQNLTQVCDFKFVFTNGIDLGGLTNPISAITGAIKSGKLAAANMVRAAMNILNNELRLIVTALLSTMGSDPTGIVSLNFSISKKLLRKINQMITYAAQVAFDISVIVNLAEDIKSIIAWIESVPAKLKAVLQRCLANFMSSVSQAENTAKNIAPSITNTLNTQLMTTQATQATTAAGVSTSTIKLASGTSTADDITNVQNEIATHISSTPSYATIKQSSSQP